MLSYYEQAQKALAQGASIEAVTDLPVRTRIAKAKLVPEQDMETAFDELMQAIVSETEALGRKEG